MKCIAKTNPKRNKRSYNVSEATELLASERMILAFLHQDGLDMESTEHKTVKNTTLYEFRIFIQKKKDKLEGESDSQVFLKD